MATAMYRKSSGEVIKISPQNFAFPDIDTEYFGVLTGPRLPDGADVRSRISAEELGPLRELGFSKFADVGRNLVRNSTQSEIDTYAPEEAEDIDDQEEDAAVVLILNHPTFKRVIRMMFDEVNQPGNSRSPMGAANRRNPKRVRGASNARPRGRV